MTGKTRLYDRIDTKFGQGGIGVFDRATDTPLGHPVAIKVQPQSDPHTRVIPHRRATFRGTGGRCLPL
jgi:hypothetical protein